MEHMPTYEDFYCKAIMNMEVFHNDWNQYSLIHNLYESFDLIVYNESHIIPNKKFTHRNSRSVLHFPADINMFILFHGNLVHNGAASKFEPNESMNYAADLRAFAYVNKKSGLARNCTLDDDNLQQRESHNENPSLG